MKKEGAPGIIDFAARSRALKERRASGAANEPSTPAPAELSEPAAVEPAARVVHLSLPKPPLRIAPESRPTAIGYALSDAVLGSARREAGRSGFNLRLLSRLGTSEMGTDGFLLLGLVQSAEDQTKYRRLVTMETALNGLFAKPANVAMRRGMIRSYGTDDLMGEFWNSTEGNWTSQPAMYTAILDELEERGFFNIADVAPPPPTPPAEPTGRRPRRGKRR